MEKSKETMPKKSIEIGKILKHSLLLYKSNFLLFVGIALLGHALLLLCTLLEIVYGDIHMGITFIIISLNYFVLFWAFIALIIAVSNRYQNKHITLKECFVKTKGKYWRYIGINILYTLILGLGLLLFLIPGIYWGTILSLAAVVVVLEARGDMGPFKISKELIKGSFWRVFLLGLIMLALSLPLYLTASLRTINENLATIFSQIFYLIYISFATVVTVNLYHELRKKKGDESPLATETSAMGIMEKKGISKWKKRFAIGCLSLIVVFLMVVGFIGFKIWGLVSEGLSKETQEEASLFYKKISQIEAEGNIPLHQMSIIKELVGIVKQKETSVWGIRIIMQVVNDAIGDEWITEDELQNQILIRDLLKDKKGRISVFDIIRLIRKHPQLEGILKTVSPAPKRP